MTRDEALELAWERQQERRPGGPAEYEAPDTEREPTEAEMEAYWEARERRED